MWPADTPSVTAASQDGWSGGPADLSERREPDLFHQDVRHVAPIQRHTAPAACATTSSSYRSLLKALKL
jgi:hypothetical protein